MKIVSQESLRGVFRVHQGIRVILVLYLTSVENSFVLKGKHRGYVTGRRTR